MLTLVTFEMGPESFNGIFQYWDYETLNPGLELITAIMKINYNNFTTISLLSRIMATFYEAKT